MNFEEEKEKKKSNINIFISIPFFLTSRSAYLQNDFSSSFPISVVGVRAGEWNIPYNFSGI